MYLSSDAMVIPIRSLYIPPALCFFSMSTALSTAPRLNKTSAICPHKMLSFILKSVFCETSSLLFSYNSNALLRSLSSFFSIPNALYKAALLYTMSKLFGYFLRLFSASARPSIFFSWRYCFNRSTLFSR